MSRSAVKFVHVTPSAVQHIADNMRQADVDEVMASHGHTAHEAMTFSIRASQLVSVVEIYDEPSCVVGLTAGKSTITRVGSPWMLGTDNITKHRKIFVKSSPVVIEDMLHECNLLSNYVHVKNHASIRWLKGLGFTIESPVEYGINEELFHPFYLRKK